MIYKIVDSADRHLGVINSAETELQAIARFVSDRSRPIYCRLHDEMPAERRVGEPGEMGFYQPPLPNAVRAVPMKQIVVNGGYGIVEA